jgi:hypothetical protein
VEVVLAPVLVVLQDSKMLFGQHWILYRASHPEFSPLVILALFYTFWDQAQRRLYQQKVCPVVEEAVVSAVLIIQGVVVLDSLGFRARQEVVVAEAVAATPFQVFRRTAVLVALVVSAVLLREAVAVVQVQMHQELTTTSTMEEWVELEVQAAHSVRLYGD